MVDKNVHQLYLIELKMRAICHLMYSNIILDFFEGRLDRFEYNMLFNKLNLSQSHKEYWQENIDFIYAGINKLGVYEVLCR